MADGETGLADADCLHHARVAQLARAQVAVKVVWPLVFVRLQKKKKKKKKKERKGGNRSKVALMIMMK